VVFWVANPTRSYGPTAAVTSARLPSRSRLTHPGATGWEGGYPPRRISPINGSEGRSRVT